VNVPHFLPQQCPKWLIEHDVEKEVAGVVDVDKETGHNVEHNPRDDAYILP